MPRARVRALARSLHRIEVSLDSDRRIEADLVVEAIGSTPAVGWLTGNDLVIADEVVADGWLRALRKTGGSWPNVYVAGDAACFPHPLSPDGPTAIPHWSTPPERPPAQLGQQLPPSRKPRTSSLLLSSLRFRHSGTIKRSAHLVVWTTGISRLVAPPSGRDPRPVCCWIFSKQATRRCCRIGDAVNRFGPARPDRLGYLTRFATSARHAPARTRMIPRPSLHPDLRRSAPNR